MVFLLRFIIFCFSQVMFIQNKGQVTMTLELLDTEEAQADDPLDVQVVMLMDKHIYPQKNNPSEVNN